MTNELAIVEEFFCDFVHDCQSSVYFIFQPVKVGSEDWGWFVGFENVGLVGMSVRGRGAHESVHACVCDLVLQASASWWTGIVVHEYHPLCCVWLWVWIIGWIVGGCCLAAVGGADCMDLVKHWCGSGSTLGSLRHPSLELADGFPKAGCLGCWGIWICLGVRRLVVGVPVCGDVGQFHWWHWCS